MKTVSNSIEAARGIKFALFADLHYKKGMYIATVSDLLTIMDRAAKNNVDFVMHMGDMSNDYLRSPELLNAYLNNGYGLAVYGIYGNHELESRDNSMQVITPRLNNREVIWGTPDGKIADGSIGYYYYDIKGFRVIGLDSNYSWNPETEEWEHNRTASWGAPAGNTREHSYGPIQLAWLEKVLQDAVQNELHCIVCSHASISGVWYSGPDAERVRALFNEANKQRAGTVMMAINGHLHTDNLKMIDGIVYFDVNTVRNGVWQGTREDHYVNETFRFTEYDADGTPTAEYDRRIAELSMGKNTWFHTDALSAVVTVYENGRVEVEGDQTTWCGDVKPPVTWANAAITGGCFTFEPNRNEGEIKII